MHFQPYNDRIYTPIIRKEVRDIKVTSEDHYTVYLPAYNDERIIKVLSPIKNAKWEVFSKHNSEVIELDNMTVKPIDSDNFLKSMASSRGILCAAGFATPSEALFLRKKLMVIPMKQQYEQYCNAEALREMGVPVLKSLKSKHAEKIEVWLKSDEVVKVDYPEVAGTIVDRIIHDHTLHADNYVNYLVRDQFHSIQPGLQI